MYLSGKDHFKYNKSPTKTSHSKLTTDHPLYLFSETALYDKSLSVFAYYQALQAVAEEEEHVLSLSLTVALVDGCSVGFGFGFDIVHWIVKCWESARKMSVVWLLIDCESSLSGGCYVVDLCGLSRHI